LVLAAWNAENTAVCMTPIQKKSLTNGHFLCHPIQPTRWYRKHNYSGHNLATAHAAYITLMQHPSEMYKR